MKKLLLILLLIVGCEEYAPTNHTHDDDMLDKTYKCELTCEANSVPEEGEYSGFSGCVILALQVEALDIDEAEEYCEDWYELDSLNNASSTYSCNCEVFP